MFETTPVPTRLALRRANEFMVFCIPFRDASTEVALDGRPSIVKRDAAVNVISAGPVGNQGREGNEEFKISWKKKEKTTPIIQNERAAGQSRLSVTRKSEQQCCSNRNKKVHTHA